MRARKIAGIGMLFVLLAASLASPFLLASGYIPNGVQVGRNITSSVFPLYGTCYDGTYYYIVYQNGTTAIDYAWAINPTTAITWNFGVVNSSLNGHGVTTACVSTGSTPGVYVTYGQQISNLCYHVALSPCGKSGSSGVGNICKLENNTSTECSEVFHQRVRAMNVSSAVLDGSVITDYGAFTDWFVSSTMLFKGHVWTSVISQNGNGFGSDTVLVVTQCCNPFLNLRLSISDTPVGNGGGNALLALRDPFGVTVPTLVYGLSLTIQARWYNTTTNVFSSAVVSGLSANIFSAAVGNVGNTTGYVLAVGTPGNDESLVSYHSLTASWGTPVDTMTVFTSTVLWSEILVDRSNVPVAVWTPASIGSHPQRVFYNYPLNETHWNTSCATWSGSCPNAHRLYDSGGDGIKQVVPQPVAGVYGVHFAYVVDTTTPFVLKWNIQYPHVTVTVTKTVTQTVVHKVSPPFAVTFALVIFAIAIPFLTFVALFTGIFERKVEYAA